MKRIVFLMLAGLLIIGAGVFLFRSRSIQKNGTSGKIEVVASFYPLAEFASRIGGNFVRVTDLTPPGMEPHDYEPTPRQIGDLYSAKLFLYNGNGLDAWAEKIHPDLERRGVRVLNMRDTVSASVFDSDPHFWLDPVIAEQEAVQISEALEKIDTGHAATYQKNRGAFISELSRLDQEYKNGLVHCEHREIIVSHDAFGYLARRYGIDELFIAGFSPDAEPAPQKIAELVQTIEQKNIHIIFFETLVSPKIAETIANETGAETRMLNPIEGLSSREADRGENYLSLMRENL
ncbi:MAG TPA: zinc ABC transporter substrate-binding protein, partial [Patescibacteria group bacterium]|nr:zinc ABC transporter substrate-binding protein [Patescibacteria group bacterium]